MPAPKGLIICARAKSAESCVPRRRHLQLCEGRHALRLQCHHLHRSHFTRFHHPRCLREGAVVVIDCADQNNQARSPKCGSYGFCLENEWQRHGVFGPDVHGRQVQKGNEEAGAIAPQALHPARILFPRRAASSAASISRLCPAADQTAARGSRSLRRRHARVRHTIKTVPARVHPASWGPSTATGV